MNPQMVLVACLVLTGLGMAAAPKLADRARAEGTGSPLAHVLLVAPLYATSGAPAVILWLQGYSLEPAWMWRGLFLILTIAVLGHTLFAVRGPGQKLVTLVGGSLLCWFALPVVRQLLK